MASAPALDLTTVFEVMSLSPTTGHRFWHLPHSRLSQLLHCEMHENHFLFAGALAVASS